MCVQPACAQSRLFSCISMCVALLPTQSQKSMSILMSFCLRLCTHSSRSVAFVGRCSSLSMGNPRKSVGFPLAASHLLESVIAACLVHLLDLFNTSAICSIHSQFRVLISHPSRTSPRRPFASLRDTASLAVWDPTLKLNWVQRTMAVCAAVILQAHPPILRRLQHNMPLSVSAVLRHQQAVGTSCCELARFN